MRYAKSNQQLERALRTIPLGSQTFSKAYNRWPDQAPHFLSHGKGSRVWDIDGNEYVDFVSALLPNVLGYGDPDIDGAIRRQLDKGISFSLPTVLESELAERLCRLIPCADMVRFGKSGTDATSAAVRLARAYTGRDHIIMCGYHGWQDWYIGHAEKEENRAGVPKNVRALSHMVAPDDYEAVSRLIVDLWPEKVAAIIVDCSKGDSPWGGPGKVPDKAAWLSVLRATADRYGAILIFDEVITGFRYDIGGAQKLYGVTPDLACFSKALGNGMPISAVVGRRDLMRMFDHVFFSGTFGGETLSLAAAIACVDKIERENVCARLATTGTSLTRSLATSSYVWTSGHPSMPMLNFADAKVREVYLSTMLANGVLVNTSFNVCYAHSSEDIELVSAAHTKALYEIERTIDRAA